MKTTETPKSHSAKDLLEVLSTAGARGRVQLHVLSLDARDTWQDLESKIETLQAKIGTDGERLNASATKKAGELTHAVKHLLQRNGGIAELAAPAASPMRPAQTCAPNDPLNEAAVASPEGLARDDRSTDATTPGSSRPDRRRGPAGGQCSGGVTP